MKTVKISELKAKLSFYIRMLSKGEDVLILDRQRPVGVLKGLKGDSALQIESATHLISGVLDNLPPIELSDKVQTFESTEILLADRARR